MTFTKLTARLLLAGLLFPTLAFASPDESKAKKAPESPKIEQPADAKISQQPLPDGGQLGLGHVLLCE